MVGIGIQNHRRARVELVVGADAPEERPPGIRLLNTKQNKKRNDAGELGNHAPIQRPLCSPWAVENSVAHCESSWC